MIAHDFIYCRPDTLREAADAFSLFQAEGKTALYYAGGSEIITMCRAGSIRPDAVIDIKHISECREMLLEGQTLHIGSACTLNQISTSKLFPLLGLSCGRIADHTNQCRITLGGNLCGTILYRETSLPLLLADADITLFGTEGERTVPFCSVFDGRTRRKPGELIVRLHIPDWALAARHFHIKRTANEKIDYPLVSAAALCRGEQLRVGFSGLCSRPFRSQSIEAQINDRAKTIEERVELAAALLPEPPRSDREGAGEYRLFVWKNILRSLLEEWEHDTV